MKMKVVWGLFDEYQSPHRTDARGGEVSDGVRFAKLDSGGVVAVPLRATFTDDRMKVTMCLDVANGVPICAKYCVERTDGRGLEEVTTEISRGLNLRTLMAHAFAGAAHEQHEDDDGRDHLRRASTVEAVEAVIGPIRRRREPTTDERLREFADAYRERWVPGGAAEFAESLYVSERQMWRLKRLAVDRGFLKEES
jgi:hypothetical protein